MISTFVCTVLVLGFTEVNNRVGRTTLQDRVRPPSMQKIWPVMYAAAGIHRNATSDQTSSGLPARRIGVRAISSCTKSGEVTP